MLSQPDPGDQLVSASAVPQNWHGIGDPVARLQVLVAKAPPMLELATATGVQPLLPGQVQHIAAHCGNGWRKVFNVYSKLVLALPSQLQPALAGGLSWQQWRDRQLLQSQSDCALLFGEATALLALQLPPRQQLRLIAGRQHARALLAAGAPLTLQWLDDEFAVDVAQRTLVCPYFDYRQLSDRKIARLVALTAPFAAR